METKGEPRGSGFDVGLPGKNNKRLPVWASLLLLTQENYTRPISLLLPSSSPNLFKFSDLKVHYLLGRSSINTNSTFLMILLCSQFRICKDMG